jgi:quercetin dioxygenase-like cupin family protein
MSELANVVTEIASVNQAHIAEVEAYEIQLKQFEQIDLPVKHYFSKGVYARELFIPKGAILTGHIHKYENLNIMSKGDMSILTENGVIRVQAPYTIVSPPGTKRLARAHEDTIWTTIHGTEETDLEVIEEKFIAHSNAEYIAFCKQIEEK